MKKENVYSACKCFAANLEMSILYIPNFKLYGMAQQKAVHSDSYIDS